MFGGVIKTLAFSRVFFSILFFIIIKPMEERDYLLLLNTQREIGPRTFLKLRDYFKNFSIIWQAKKTDFKQRGFTDLQIAAIEKARQMDLEKEIETLKKHQIEFVTVLDKNYPALLKEIPDPPFVLYYKGQLPKEKDFLIAVVGSRACTYYGRQATEKIVYDLAGLGITIVSGLAFGIDSLSHQVALKAKGKTIAILACGLDSVYPPSHRQLANKIIETGGALISEQHPRTLPLKAFFPLRNRIISGLSRGIIIIEAAIKSGALITARCALEQNREVFALPGSIFNPTSEGTNNLLKMGAHPLTCADDVLTEFNIKMGRGIKGSKGIRGDNKEEDLILSLLSAEPTEINELVKESKISVSLVNSTLIMLEIKGMVKNIGGGSYIKI